MQSIDNKSEPRTAQAKSREAGKVGSYLIFGCISICMFGGPLAAQSISPTWIGAWLFPKCCKRARDGPQESPMLWLKSKEKLLGLPVSLCAVRELSVENELSDSTNCCGILSSS